MSAFPLATFPTPLCVEAPAGDFDWTASTVRGLLGNRNAWTPDPLSDVFVSDAISAGLIEVGTSGYARDTLTSPTVTADLPNGLGILSGDPFNWGSPAGADDYDTVVLFHFVTSDSDSPMIAAWDLGAQTTDGNPITLSPDPTYGFLSYTI